MPSTGGVAMDPTRSRNAVQAARNRQNRRPPTTARKPMETGGGSTGIVNAPGAGAVNNPYAGAGVPVEAGGAVGTGVPGNDVMDGAGTPQGEAGPSPLNRILSRAVASGRLTPEQAAARNADRLAGLLPGQQGPAPESEAAIRARHRARQGDIAAGRIQRGSMPPTNKPPMQGTRPGGIKELPAVASLADAVKGANSPYGTDGIPASLPPDLIEMIRARMGRRMSPEAF